MTMPLLADPMHHGNRPGDGPLRSGGRPGPLQGESHLPSTESAASKAQAPAVTMVRDLWRGCEQVRARTEAYLPRAPREWPGDYAARLHRSVFVNFFRRTIEGLVGMVFRVDVALDGDVPAVIVDQWENLDLAGTHGAVFVRDLTADAMTTGHAAILVDFPDTQGRALTLAAERSSGVRPYWVPIKKENILSWRVANESGRAVLTQLVLRETAMLPVGEYGEEEVTTYRVFRRDASGVSYRLLTILKDRRVVELASGMYPTQEEIPVAEVPTAGKRALFESDPPLLDVGYLNVAHYQTWSDYATSLHMTCVPIFFTSGFLMRDEQGKAIEVGANSGLNSENPEGDAKYVSHDGSALQACKQALDDLKADIGALGLAMLTPQARAAETATAKRLDKSGSDSALAVTARGVQDAVERALGFHARYLRLPSGGSVTINRDFEGSLMDAAVMTAYAGLATALDLPDEVIVRALQAGGRIPDGVDVDDMVMQMGAARAAREDAARIEAAMATAATAATQ